MEIKTIELPIENKKVETLDEFDCEKVVLDKYYDLNGSTINEGKETFTNCHVTIKLGSHTLYGKEYKYYLVFINEKELDVEVVSIKGSSKLLKIRGCTGAG